MCQPHGILTNAETCSFITLVAIRAPACLVAHLHHAATQNAQTHAMSVARVTISMGVAVAPDSVMPIIATEVVHITNVNVAMGTRAVPSQNSWIPKLVLVVCCHTFHKSIGIL